MDLAQIGAHCSLSSCNVLDFLPITCKCERIYCSQHISPDHHDCPILKTSLVGDLPTFEDQLRRCDVDGCNKLSLRSTSSNADETCAACSKSFCVECVHISRNCKLPMSSISAQDIDIQNCITVHPLATLQIQIQNHTRNLRRLFIFQRNLKSLQPTLLS